MLKKNNIEFYSHIRYLFKICRPQYKKGPMVHYLHYEVFDSMALAWRKLNHIKMGFCAFLKNNPTISSSGLAH